MSPTMPERLRDLEADVRDLRVQPAAAVRARGRRRRRNQLAAVAAAGAVLAVTAGIAAVNWPRAESTILVAGPPPLNCVLALPSRPADVQVRVLNGGAPEQRLTATAAELRLRGFTVLDSPVGRDPVDGTALRYGPAAIGAAVLMRAELRGEFAVRFDPGRRDETIDVVLGPDFGRLATTTEVNQNLVAAGEPTAPPGC